MQNITIKPSRMRILKTNLIWLLVLCAFIMIPALYWLSPTRAWQSIGWMGAFIYLVLLLATVYTLFVFVVQALYAELTLDDGKIIFQTLGRTNVIAVSEIIDIDFYVLSHKKISRGRVREDSLFLLFPNISIVESWKITTGWEYQDMLMFVEAVRKMLSARGIKTFPLFASGDYQSSKK